MSAKNTVTDTVRQILIMGLNTHPDGWVPFRDIRDGLFPTISPNYAARRYEGKTNLSDKKVELGDKIIQGKMFIIQSTLSWLKTKGAIEKRDVDYGNYEYRYVQHGYSVSSNLEDQESDELEVVRTSSRSTDVRVGRNDGVNLMKVLREYLIGKGWVSQNIITDELHSVVPEERAKHRYMIDICDYPSIPEEEIIEHGQRRCIQQSIGHGVRSKEFERRGIGTTRDKMVRLKNDDGKDPDDTEDVTPDTSVFHHVVPELVVSEMDVEESTTQDERTGNLGLKEAANKYKKSVKEEESFKSAEASFVYGNWQKNRAGNNPEQYWHRLDQTVEEYYLIQDPDFPLKYFNFESVTFEIGREQATQIKSYEDAKAWQDMLHTEGFAAKIKKVREYTVEETIK